MAFERLIPFDELVQGDPRHSWYEGRVTTDWLQERLFEMRTSPAIPKPVLHQLTLAKQLCVAGWFFWDLYAAAVHYTTVAAEVALRHRFVESLSLPITLLPRSKKDSSPLLLEQRPDPEALVGYLRGKWRLKEFREDFRFGFKQLVDWGLESRVIPQSDFHSWDAAVELRNQYAHGSESIVPMNIPLTVLQRTIWMLNSLFPDAETEAYDAPRREAAQREIETVNAALREGFSSHNE